MKMNVTDTVKQACGHWPRILPALGVAAPSLSFLGLAVMDELCARHITAPALH
ncbi:DUF5375 family protein [Citrobacter sp. L55]|uniref:DUF5375 family protein n=1 Tax=Citrobacter sp. L55 TaxID=1981983 RepID=UPI00143D5480